MSSQGPKLPGTGADDGSVGSFAWTNPGNITADDGVSATDAGDSHYLKGTNFGFSIPGGSIITNIKVDIRIMCTSSNSTPTYTRARLYIGGVLSGSNKAAGDVVPSSWTIKTYSGDPISYWGLSSISASDVNGSTFGFGLTCGTDGTDGFAVDYFKITITYAPGVGPQTVKNPISTNNQNLYPIIGTPGLWITV